MFMKQENILLKIIYGMNIDNSLLDKKVNELSGGQKSKMHLQDSFIQNREIILLDEPTNHWT
jgi:ATP-binding cassette subfamily F protein 3